MAALGEPPGLRQLRDALDRGFETNPVCGIGSERLDLRNYQTFGFTFHQVVYGPWSGDTVYDATLAQKWDLGGNLYQYPPGGWTLNGYWQTPFPNPPPGMPLYLGLANRYIGSIFPDGEPVAKFVSTILLDTLH